MKYRLALDLGSTSLGWCVLSLNERGCPASLMDAGVRIFPDGRDAKSKEPLAVTRRKARALRRNLDRREARQKRLMRLMIQSNLMPQDEELRKQLEKLDPYEWRAKALHEKIPLHHLGRALFHLNQRRGFKSNRKTDKEEKNTSNMKNAISGLEKKIIDAGCQTLGEYFWKQKQENKPVRVRTAMVNNKAEYNFYPGREMYQKEVEAIFTSQRKYYPELTDEICKNITDTVFFQRRMKPPLVGKCQYEIDKFRIRKAHPLFQQFRIFQDVSHLELDIYRENAPHLKKEYKEKIVEALSNEKKISFSELRMLLVLPRGCKFNLETESRKELNGNTTTAILSDKKCFGDQWKLFSIQEQEDIIDLLFTEDDPDELMALLTQTYHLDQAQANAVAFAKLEEGYGSLSKEAIEKILPGLKEWLTYDKAVAKVYPHHSDFRTGVVYDHLPYYGEILPNSVIGGTTDIQDKHFPEKYFGKINNPTVHIALNQVRKLVNALIDKHGHPEEIVVELARDLKEPPDTIKKEQRKNKKENDRINKELEKIGVKQNYRNRMLFKIWEDLAKDPKLRCCPFCDDENSISAGQVFTSAYEEEHLLPYSISFNDGRANKVIAHQHCNREKGNRTPFKAFASNGKRWQAILAKIQHLPANKQWRFKEDAWEIAKGKGEDIIARMLNDTRYMSKITRQYLSAVFDNEKGKSKVYAIPGQMTALLRDQWGLNRLVADVWKKQVMTLFPDKPNVRDLLENDNGQKNRAHHLHHAVDAFVVGCTDRGMLKRISDAARNLESKTELWEKRKKLVDSMPEPFDHFREQLTNKIDNLVVSYKPDHGGAAKAIQSNKPFTVSSLHDQTAYGYIRKGDKKNKIIVATRKPMDAFDTKKHVEKIADLSTRIELLSVLDGVQEKSNEWKEVLTSHAKEKNIRHLRIHIEKTEDIMMGVKQPKDRGPQKTRGKKYKLYAFCGNDRADIWYPTKGKHAGKWQCEVISNYNAHQKNFMPKWRRENPTAKLIMRLQVNDMLAYEENNITKISQVTKLDLAKNIVFLRNHIIALNKPDFMIWGASSNQLQEKNARKISVDIIGRIKDPKKKPLIS